MAAAQTEGVFNLLFHFLLLVRMIQIKLIFHENLDFCINIDFHTC